MCEESFLGTVEDIGEPPTHLAYPRFLRDFEVAGKMSGVGRPAVDTPETPTSDEPVWALNDPVQRKFGQPTFDAVG